MGPEQTDVFVMLKGRRAPSGARHRSELAAESRNDIARVSRLLVPAPGGERVPLAQLAKVRLVEAPAQISRENGIRRVVVEANIRGRDLGGFVADVKARLAPFEKELPPGAFLELGGQFENQQRAMRTFAVVVPAARALILLLLYLALGSVGDSLLALAGRTRR